VHTVDKNSGHSSELARNSYGQALALLHQCKIGRNTLAPLLALLPDLKSPLHQTKLQGAVAGEETYHHQPNIHKCAMHSETHVVR